MVHALPPDDNGRPTDPPDARGAPPGLSRLRLLANEGRKLWRHGPGFPRAMEEVAVETATVRRVIADPLELRRPAANPALAAGYKAARAARGRVIGDMLFAGFASVPVSDLVKIRCCLDHWGNGTRWEATGIFEHMLGKIARSGRPQSGCRTIDDLRRRYAGLDRIFGEVARDRRLKGLRDLGGRAPLWSRRGNNWDGIEIHIGPDGEPIFGDAGTHRLAMAQVLGLERVPVLLGFVHRSAVAQVPRFRALRTRLPGLAPLGWVMGAI